MTTKSNRKSAARAKSAALPQTVAEHVAQATDVPAVSAILDPIAVIASAEAPAVTEPVADAPAPVVTETPAAPAVVAEVAKVSWEETMKKAQASFAKTGSFREGTNRAILFPLLDREEGLSLSEAAAATQARGGKPRSLSSIHTDLHDIAKITQRKLVRCDKGEVKRYRLAAAPVAPVAPATETVAS
jgi:hypothetical protein